MSRVATTFAIETMRKMLGHESGYRSLFLGGYHDIAVAPETHIDWVARGLSGNANFMFEQINAGSWNLIVNCCCEHMYPMSEIKLPAMYVLQSNNRYGDNHINRSYDMNMFLGQVNLDDVYYKNTSWFAGAEYFTIIGEKW